MKHNICVGAAEGGSGKLIRLIPEDGQRFHSWQEFDAEVGAIVQIVGNQSVVTEPPHVEDYVVKKWRQLDDVEDLVAWVEQKCDICEGGPGELFDGYLQSTAAGSRYITREAGIPTHSVEFWRLPYDLVLHTWRNDDKPDSHTYQSVGSGVFKVKYVGTEEPVKKLAAGTIVRVSLARWHQFPNDDVEKCWLQLSGWYLDQFDF